MPFCLDKVISRLNKLGSLIHWVSKTFETLPILQNMVFFFLSFFIFKIALLFAPCRYGWKEKQVCLSNTCCSQSKANVGTSSPPLKWVCRVKEITMLPHPPPLPPDSLSTLVFFKGHSCSSPCPSWTIIGKGWSWSHMVLAHSTFGVGANSNDLPSRGDPTINPNCKERPVAWGLSLAEWGRDRRPLWQYHPLRNGEYPLCLHA